MIRTIYTSFCSFDHYYVSRGEKTSVRLLRGFIGLSAVPVCAKTTMRTTVYPLLSITVIIQHKMKAHSFFCHPAHDTAHNVILQLATIPFLYCLQVKIYKNTRLRYLPVGKKNTYTIHLISYNKKTKILIKKIVFYDVH